MLPVLFVNGMTLQLLLQHGPSIPLVHARPTMIRIVVFGNALRSHLQHETPRPPRLLGPRMLHLLHLQ